MKLLTSVIPLFLLLTTSPFATSAPENGAPFAVVGEQLDYAAPKGWKLAWMDGKPDGSYVAEYIPQTEEINSWRDGYLAIARLPYPPAQILKEIENSKTTISELALIQYIQKAKDTCGGKHEAMSQRTNTFNDIYVAVGGGFCDKYGSAAPFGEGAFVAFAQGKNYLFRVRYGWRPRSDQNQSDNLPWRITPSVAKEYLEAIKALSLCAGVGQPACKNNYVR
jgi:hypothetical protein